MKSTYKISNDDIVQQENRRFQSFRDENSGKKICILYGNCHMSAIRDVLQSVPEFIDSYTIFPVKAIQEVKSPAYFQSEAFHTCDVFIHQSIQLNNRYGKEYASENIIKQLSYGCQVISVPNLYHLPVCFFPQYINKEEFMWQGSTIFFRDALLDFAYNRGYRLQEALELYRGKKRPQEVWRLLDLDEMFESFVRKVRLREEDWNIKIVDFILENYQSQQLFFDPNHPTPVLIKQISKGILHYLNIRFEEDYLDSLDVLRLDAYEMPICSAVKEHFHMAFDQEIMRLTGKKVMQIPMDISKYIKEYWAMEWQNQELSLVKRALSYLRFIIYKVYNKYSGLKKHLKRGKVI